MSGHQTSINSGFNNEQWIQIARKFKELTNLEGYSPVIFKTELRDLIKNYEVWRNLKDNTGFQWNEAEGMITAPPAHWESYIKNIPQVARYRYWKLEHWQQLLGIFTGRFSISDDTKDIICYKKNNDDGEEMSDNV